MFVVGGRESSGEKELGLKRGRCLPSLLAGLAGHDATSGIQGWQVQYGGHVKVNEWLEQVYATITDPRRATYRKYYTAAYHCMLQSAHERMR